jgi:hypothetical protein
MDREIPLSILPGLNEKLHSASNICDSARLCVPLSLSSLSLPAGRGRQGPFAAVSPPRLLLPPREEGFDGYDFLITK